MTEVTTRSLVSNVYFDVSLIYYGKSFPANLTLNLKCHNDAEGFEGTYTNTSIYELENAKKYTWYFYEYLRMPIFDSVEVEIVNPYTNEIIIPYTALEDVADKVYYMYYWGADNLVYNSIEKKNYALKRDGKSYLFKNKENKNFILKRIEQ